MAVRVRRLIAAIAATLSCATAAAALNVPAAATTAGLHWTRCHGGYFCAHVLVPLDYDHPRGVQISIALVKQPATDKAHRIGSLFLNPGGPGGSGVDFLLAYGHRLFTPEVRARFDLIGFDPRGIDRSTQLQCFPNERTAFKALPPFPYPDSAAERAVWIRDDRRVETACGRHGNAILDHMSTADTARDLDRLRQAVGDRSLTYYGVSYGSFLGNVYANLFPNRVRSVVVDGVLDPIAWTTGRPGEQQLPFSTRLRSDVGAAATLNEFFRLCNAGGRNCPFGPNAALKYSRLYRELRAHPLSIHGVRYDETFLVGDTLSAMYDSSSWPDFAKFLAHLAARARPATLASERAALRTRYGRYVNYVEGFPGVACSDSINPNNPDAWTHAAEEAKRVDGLFGPLWTWISSVCARWPGQDSDRYLGPFTHRTAHPVLVVGNLYDPATRYEGAQTVARLLPNSRLLTVHGWGHTSLFLSHCADRDIARYLLTSDVPQPGTVCNQDHVPFQHTSAATAPTTGDRSSAQFPLWAGWRRAR